MNTLYLGIDVGSVSTNLVVLNKELKVVDKLYMRTHGQPIKAIKGGLKLLKRKLDKDIVIGGVGTTGSGRQLVSVIVGADIVKNEITAHAVAAIEHCPNVKTIIEIGGQDSKIIIIKDKIVCDFAMNTVCAAGTGSFLDRQASRLNIPIQEFGKYALKSKTPVRIAGRCAVFAESDMIHKQQTGQNTEDIINGLCIALVRNYLNNLAKGKEILEPILFQGGVAANVGIIAAFEKELGKKVVVPNYYDVMGAVGAAILGKIESEKNNKTKFLGFELVDKEYKTRSFECKDCPNMCEVIEIYADGMPVSRWGDRCGKHSEKIQDGSVA
jgi:predicted CoA-substrate-specific enzyme activase